MKRFFNRIKTSLLQKDVRADNDSNNNSIIGSWRLISYTDFQSKEVKPHWKEVWSFAAMNEGETNGIYACDYINLHTIIGKWELTNKRLKLVRKECENEYVLAELSDDKLILKPNGQSLQHDTF